MVTSNGTNFTWPGEYCGEPSAVVPDVAAMTPEGPHDTESDIDRGEEANQQPPDTDGVV